MHDFVNIPFSRIKRKKKKNTNKEQQGKDLAPLLGKND